MKTAAALVLFLVLALAVIGLAVLLAQLRMVWLRRKANADVARIIKQYGGQP